MEQNGPSWRERVFHEDDVKAGAKAYQSNDPTVKVFDLALAKKLLNWFKPKKIRLADKKQGFD